jgi:hypothetical protein
VTVEVKDRPRYDDDFYAWTRDQAKHLRAQRSLRQNEPLDWHELAEEVEDLGRSELHTCQSLTDQIIAHLLKLQFSGATEPRVGWRTELAAFRASLRRRLTPSIRRKIEAQLEDHFAEARNLVLPGFETYEPDRLGLLPKTCPYTFAQILSPDDWLPETAQSEA